MVKRLIVAAAVLLSAALFAAAPARSASVPATSVRAAGPATSITVNGNGGGREYNGVGAVLGGGGTARYLEDYPPAQQAQILDYLFKPGYGASLQLLKLEIGGDGNSSDGAEPSVEHRDGHINCSAGYEFAIARQAVALNPRLKLYGLQWGAPHWAGRNGSLFTRADIRYLLDWLGCARQQGLTISYLGGWDEDDHGGHAKWYRRLRRALDAGGHRHVQIIAADGISGDSWRYTANRHIAILGAHNNCGYPTAAAGAQTACGTTGAARGSGKPLWGSELGGIDSGVQAGCSPCAPAIDRAFTREYIDARVTGILAWPAIESMPAVVLRHEDRGLLTADQPWSGSYNVNALTWAIAHITQFAALPTARNPGGWNYINSASGYLQGNRADGSYVTLLRSTRNQWSTIIETTGGVTGAQQVSFTVTGGQALASKTVHVWSSNFSSGSGPDQWFARGPDITPVNGTFTLTIKPGYVYSLTTTSGQGKGTAVSPPAAVLSLPYRNNLSAGSAGDDEPALLATEEGSFELASCTAPDGATTCTRQTARRKPVLWSNSSHRHPYAIIGSDWTSYVVSADVMIPRSGSAGLIGRYDAVSPAQGTYNAYIFNVSTDGRFTLRLSNGGTATDTIAGERQVRPASSTVLAAGHVAFAERKWHSLSLSLSGGTIRASVDGRQVASVSNSAFTSGIPGIEVGGWYRAYFSNLAVTSP
jgi:Glycosyl hydrolase family 59